MTEAGPAEAPGVENMLEACADAFSALERLDIRAGHAAATE